ncbi:MAG TPA: hypothetical protein VMH22_03595 [bacterium]|nr:hypothetical protein [bacterium]
MQVASLDELKKAVKALEPEIVVTDEALVKKVLFWNTLRAIANVVVIVILAVGIAAWANPLRIPELEQTWALLARRIILGVGVLMLFAEYVIPVVRLYKPAGKDSLGLKLVPRKSSK